MNRVLGALLERSPLFLTVLSLALVAFIGAVDYASRYELSLAVFYLAPVVLATWGAGRFPGILVSAVAAVAWRAEILAERHYSSSFIPYWNTAVRFALLLTVALLLLRLKESLERERQAARMDFLTGVANSRLFAELARVELSRAQRYSYPVTVAYVDLDNFKQVNDRFGHAEGDKLLRAVGRALRTHLRATDVVARMGGDEFALLLPETSEGAAPKLLAKLRDALLETVRQQEWPVTFSIGAITFVRAPAWVDDVLRQVDTVMYEVKRSGKNRLEHRVAL